MTIEDEGDVGAEVAAVPNWVYRALAETLIKNTRWDEWRQHGLKWQHDRITELADAMEKWFPSSDLAGRLDKRVEAAEAEAFAGFMRALLAALVVCPVHGIPDCGPLLNGCSIPRHIAEWRGEFMDDLRAALAP